MIEMLTFFGVKINFFQEKNIFSFGVVKYIGHGIDNI